MLSLILFSVATEVTYHKFHVMAGGKRGERGGITTVSRVTSLFSANIHASVLHLEWHVNLVEYAATTKRRLEND